MKCNACGAEIVFVRIPGGRNLPFDAEPIPFIPDIAGTDRYLMDGGLVIRGCRPIGGEPDTHYGRIIHWATCAQADRFRRRNPHD